MHELSLAMDLVEQLTEVAARENASAVTGIHVVIGAMSGVERIPFEFAFPEAARNTPMEGAVLNIEEVPVVIRCSDCCLETEIHNLLMVCPWCNSVSVEVIQGKEFIIKSMEIR
ncbi:MAG: hydrogenase maturation nickel metallochaperone HypA [Planctomycetota bacterium]|nr:MAG: hydrogenase maturation nickel metallochaperone HypA [Planctomycetota bacterium]